MTIFVKVIITEAIREIFNMSGGLFPCTFPTRPESEHKGIFLRKLLFSAGVKTWQQNCIIERGRELAACEFTGTFQGWQNINL